MKENIKGFWYLCWLAICLSVFLDGIKEIVHFLAIGEFLASGEIAIITGICFFGGGRIYGLVRERLMQDLLGRQ
nr:hypothetical protein [Clostridioides sp.]